MKRLFAGLLVGTMVMAGSSTVFAATDAQAIKLVKLEDTTKATQTIKAEKIKLNGNQVFDIKADMLIEAVELTEEQIIEMEKAQKEFDDKLKEVCKEAGYDYNTIMTKMQNGTLTEEEQEVLGKAGLFITVCTAVSSDTVELTKEQVVEMEKAAKEFEAQLDKVAQSLGYNLETMRAKIQDGTLTEKEEAALGEIGVQVDYAVETTVAVESVEAMQK